MAPFSFKFFYAPFIIYKRNEAMLHRNIKNPFFYYLASFIKEPFGTLIKISFLHNSTVTPLGYTLYFAQYLTGRNIAPGVSPGKTSQFNSYLAVFSSSPGMSLVCL